MSLVIYPQKIVKIPTYKTLKHGLMRIGIVWITAIKHALDAESFEQFYDRVEAFRLHLVRLAYTKPNDNIAVISHGYFYSCLKPYMTSHNQSAKY